MYIVKFKKFQVRVCMRLESFEENIKGNANLHQPSPIMALFIFDCHFESYSPKHWCKPNCKLQLYWYLCLDVSKIYFYDKRVMELVNYQVLFELMAFYEYTNMVRCLAFLYYFQDSKLLYLRTDRKYDISNLGYYSRALCWDANFRKTWNYDFKSTVQIS